MTAAFRILTICLACSLASHAFAWGEEGHRLVAEIATRHLSAAALRQVKMLLAEDRAANGALSGRRSLAEIASWADETRDVDANKVHREWHYDNMALCGRSSYARYCRDGRCASAQLARQIEILSDSSEPLASRNEALKWVVHLMGDIHQPLHAATYRDGGGNAVEVSFFGERENQPYGTIRLHTIWDVQLLRRLLGERGGERGFLAAPINDADKAAWQQGTIAGWIGEAHRIARTVVYAKLGASCAHPLEGVIAVDEAYYVAAAPIIEGQIRKAGVRLARMLNEALR